MVAGTVAGVAAPVAQAQEADGCYNPRGGRMGCMVEIRNFNFVDPVLDDTGNWRLRGRIYIVGPDMQMIEVNPEGWPTSPRLWAAGTGR
jgi:hypothetical protein